MINAKECRVNNRYNRELQTSRGMLYDHDFILTEEWMGKLFGDNISIALQDLNPIPLTPKILEKCGFDYDASYELPKVQKGNFILWDSCDGTFGANFGYLMQLDVDVEFLHQLQNLYYALTGEELNYTP